MLLALHCILCSSVKKGTLSAPLGEAGAFAGPRTKICGFVKIRHALPIASKNRSAVSISAAQGTQKIGKMQKAIRLASLIISNLLILLF
jgi:hypothetical protein